MPNKHNSPRTPHKKGKPRNKKRQPQQRKTSHCYIREKDLDNVQPIEYTDRNEYLLTCIGNRTRGLGLRHFKQLSAYMHDIDFPNRKSIKISFFKFKFMISLCPTSKKDLVWIFKNLLTLEGQKLYRELTESFMDIGPSILQRPDQKSIRIIDYLWNTNPDLWLPYSAFPLISYKKSRMDLSLLPAPQIDRQNVKFLVNSYLTSIQVQRLFVPPPDILHKIGNQFYNDSGEVKKDFERHTTYDSGFLYTEFMAAPLQPREVWIPSKKLKNNNIFWMLIGRQFLKNDPTYPSNDLAALWQQLKGMSHYLRFDLSGFGLQYPREILEITIECIQELYPCSRIDEMGEEAKDLLRNPKVIMPDGTRIYPPRGIGLGYYEDLKTIGVLSILREHRPYSVYGDQALLRYDSYPAIWELISNGFIFSSDDKIQASSNTATSDWRVKWAGCSFSPTDYYEAKRYSSKLLQVFFQRYHWERKAGLLSFSKEFEDFYRANEKRIIDFYIMYFGDEFYPGDTRTSFYDTGISSSKMPEYGIKKDYNVINYRQPFEDSLFEPPYNTPFQKRSAKLYPLSLGRKFQKKRIDVYKNTPYMDTSVHFYVEPRVELHGHFKPKDRMIPVWADYLYACLYGGTTGGITYDLSPSQMAYAISNMSLYEDPLRAYASGGIKIFDTYHRTSVPSKEWIEVVKYLSKLVKRPLDYVMRADLHQDMSMQFDNLYKNTDLTINNPLFTRKRKREDYIEDQSNSDLYESIKKMLTNEMRTGEVTRALDVLPYLENVEVNLDSSSEYSFGDDDQIVYIDEIYIEEIL